ncbi:FimV/HubP family polar landmark protein [Comamonas sp. GB3 AK4-5]|uniref:FimV/HubP family polar landmark protein n=1 Tax=Comamonas sp. GB3 AK4-5 TaxID=3231487 RepID=UPI00351DE58A
MHRWKLSALAAAAFVSAALTPTDASALALGRISVQSALGEPLRAEIDIPLATPAELDALKAGIATPEVFKAHGMEYSGSARLVQIEVVRQADGTAKLRLSSRGPVSDPFVDLVIDANWSAGQLVRSYTLLLDPPAAAQPAPAPIVTAPQIREAAPAPAAPAPASVTGRSYGSDGAAPAPSPAAAPTAPARTAAAAPSASAATKGDVTVRAGDTAGRIANANRPAGVSLDQMLVAMLRANPNAFINDNVNLLRAGSVVKLPGKEEASATTAKEARQLVAAQSRDFNEFRRRLAAKAPTAKVAAADRASSGQVQAQVQDHSANAAAADKLTLSKGTVQGQHAAEEKLAQAKQASAQSDRTDELQRNLAELQKVAAASGAPAPEAGATADASAPGITVPLTAPAALDAPAAEAVTPNTADAADSTAAPPAEASTTDAKTPPEAATPPAPPPDFLDEITPVVLPAAGGILALLLGLLGWNLVKRRRAQAAAPDSPPAADATEAHSDVQPSAQAASAEAASQNASEATDPVAEAEVYLAYGRDVQAEDILKQALQTQPDRLDVHMKLAEIYAKRRDAKALEAAALSVQSLTQGTGPDWDRVVEWGLQVDASNPLYQDPSAPANSAFSAALAKSQGAAAPMAAAAAATTSLAQHLPPDLDLSLDMDLPGGLSDASPAAVANPPAAPTPSESDFAALEPDWDDALAESATPATTPVKPLDLSTLEFSLDTPPATPAPAAASALDTNLDLSALNLDLGDAPPAAAPAVAADDPLATKLDLAREFHAIGDSEGARTLVEEVIAEASGELKERAQRLLAEID